MTTLLEFDPFDLIDLAEYLDRTQLEQIRELYVVCQWDWYPPDALKWRFADVCALYFRARKHSDVFLREPEAAAALYAIERAIKEYLEDEFA